MQIPSLKKNFLYSIFYQILTLLTPLITAPYVSRILEADGIGIYSYTNSLMSYFATFAALGVLSYGSREIARHRDDKKEYSQLFWEIEILLIFTTTVMESLWILFSILYVKYRAFMMIWSIQIISVGFDISWFFSGLEQYGYIVKKNTICKLISIGLIFLLVNEKKDLWVYILIMVSSAILGNMSMWTYLPGFLVKIDWNTVNIRRHFRSTVIYFIPTIAASVYTILDKTLIGIIKQDNFENGYYEQAEKIINMAKAVTFTALNNIMGARVSYLFAENRVEEIRIKIDKALNYVLFMGIAIVFGISGIAHTFVPWFFGSGYEKVSNLLILFSPIIIIVGISNCAGSLYYTPAGLRVQSTKYIIFGSVTNLVLSVFLIPKWGCYGAAMGTMLAEIVVTVLYVHNSNGFFEKSKIFLLSWKKLIAAIIMAIVVSYEGSHYEGGICLIISQVFSGIMIYFLMLYMMKDDFFLFLIEMFTHRVRMLGKKVQR